MIQVFLVKRYKRKRQRNGKREYRWACVGKPRTAGDARAPVLLTVPRPRPCKSRNGPS